MPGTWGSIELDVVVLELLAEDAAQGSGHLLNVQAASVGLLVIIVIRTPEEESIRGDEENQKRDEELHLVLIFFDVIF